MIVGFVDISGIIDHHCFPILKGHYLISGETKLISTNPDLVSWELVFLKYCNQILLLSVATLTWLTVTNICVTNDH
jgi:hypothetical protein